MSRRSWVSTLTAVLIVCAAPRAGEAGTDSAGLAGADSAAHCTGYSTGSDMHTVCALPRSASPGSAIACHSYTVGSDTHAECASVPALRLSTPRGQSALPVPPPVSAVRCYTYHIGASAYTDCR